MEQNKTIKWAVNILRQSNETVRPQPLYSDNVELIRIARRSIDRKGFDKA